MNNKFWIGIVLLISLIGITPIGSIATMNNSPGLNNSEKIHEIHIGPGTVGLQCDRCHGFPAVVHNPERGCDSCHNFGTQNTVRAAPVVNMTSVVNVATGSDMSMTVGNTDTPAYVPAKVPTMTPVVIETPVVTKIMTRTSTITPAPVPVVNNAPVVTPAVSTKRAQLSVSYNIDSMSGGRVNLRVIITNIGSDTAKEINVTIGHPAILDPNVISGSSKIGNNITWKGELKQNETHVMSYSIKAISGKDINVPVVVTYARSSSTSVIGKNGVMVAGLTQSDMDTITFVINVSKMFLPGFESLYAIASLLGCFAFSRKIYPKRK